MANLWNPNAPRFIRRGRKVKPKKDSICGPGESPWVTSIRYQYEQAGLFNWSNRMVNSVARILRCTVDDLCALCGCCDQAVVRRYQNGNNGRGEWPAVLTVQFNKIMRFRTGMKTPDKQDLLTAQIMRQAEYDENIGRDERGGGEGEGERSEGGGERGQLATSLQGQQPG